jgi:hypothetical protein
MKAGSAFMERIAGSGWLFKLPPDERIYWTKTIAVRRLDCHRVELSLPAATLLNPCVPAIPDLLS